jgi:hypothetical protein
MFFFFFRATKQKCHIAVYGKTKCHIAATYSTGRAGASRGTTSGKLDGWLEGRIPTFPFDAVHFPRTGFFPYRSI